MIAITLPDGSVRNYEDGASALDVARSISEGLARNVLSAEWNGQTVEAAAELPGDGSLRLFTWNDPQGKQAFWHSSAHVMAQALLKLYPDAKLTIGPAIENGFYYDVDLGEQSLSEKDFPALESKMIELAREKAEFKMRSVRKAEALALYAGNGVKTELTENLEDGSITFCDHSDFTDLCRGGHIPNTGVIKAIKVMNVAGPTGGAKDEK